MASSHGFLKYAALPLAGAVALIAIGTSRDHGDADLYLGISVLIAALLALGFGFAGALEHRRERARVPKDRRD